MSRGFFTQLNDGNVKQRTWETLGEKELNMFPSHGIAFPHHETTVLSCLSAREAVSCTECRKNLWLNLQARLRWSSLAPAQFVPINSFARVDRQASDYWASLSPMAWQWASW